MPTLFFISTSLKRSDLRDQRGSTEKVGLNGKSRLFCNLLLPAQNRRNKPLGLACAACFEQFACHCKLRCPALCKDFASQNIKNDYQSILGWSNLITPCATFALNSYKLFFVRHSHDADAKTSVLCRARRRLSCPDIGLPIIEQ